MVEEGGDDPVVEVADGRRSRGRLGERGLRGLDGHEDVPHVRAGQPGEVDRQLAAHATGQAAGIVGADGGDPRPSAHGDEHVAGQAHVEHLVGDDAADQGGDRVGPVPHRPPGAQVRRDGGEFQLHRHLQGLPQPVGAAGRRGDGQQTGDHAVDGGRRDAGGRPGCRGGRGRGCRRLQRRCERGRLGGGAEDGGADGGQRGRLDEAPAVEGRRRDHGGSVPVVLVFHRFRHAGLRPREAWRAGHGTGRTREAGEAISRAPASGSATPRVPRRAARAAQRAPRAARRRGLPPA